MNERLLDYGSFVSSPDVKKDPMHKKQDSKTAGVKKTVENRDRSSVKKIKPVAKPVHTSSKASATGKKTAIKNGSALKNNSAENNIRPRRRTSISGKLIFIISSLVVISMGLITFLVSYYVTEDTGKNAEQSNFTLNTRTAAGCENRINGIVSNVSFFCDLIVTDDENKNIKDFVFENSFVKITEDFFKRNPDVAAVYFSSDDFAVYNKEFLKSNNISTPLIDAYFSTNRGLMQSAENGSPKIANASPYFSFAMLGLFYKMNVDKKPQVVSVLYASDKLAESISTGRINESFLINDRGVILLTSNPDVMIKASDMSANEFVKQVLEENDSGKQIRYTDSQGIEYIAACKKITDANCRVITQVKCDVVLEAIRITTRRNIALTAAILSIAIIVIWIFAKTISVPLIELTEVTDQINQGNFNTELFDSLNTKRTDEIGILNLSTKNERDILNTVTSLTNKGVTKAIVRKEIDFNPHLKDVTVFFSDIRGFTAISDGFNKRFGDKSAAEIIGFLNDYMSRMVNCISITGGVVDKFEGDAVMAAWGVLRDDNLENEDEQHKKNVKLDALSAIRATVAMRYSLMKYNKDAEEFTEKHKNEPLAQYKPHIRIGCGLNSGRATVGFMGSSEKMEFTSIGDAVNLASRTESSNKPCGTDILITQDTYSILKNDFIRCKENNFTISEKNIPNEIIVEKIPVTFEVKGKGKQNFYAVVNMPQFDIGSFFRMADPDFTVDPACETAVGPKGPKTLAQLRKMLGIPTPDFERVNLDEEENKIKVQ